MYIKLLGSLIVLGTAAYAGFGVGEHYSRRLSMLREWRKLLYVIQGEIRFCQAPLSEIFSHAGERSSDRFAGWMGWVSEELGRYEGKTFRRIWEEGVQKYLRDTALEASDLEQIRELGVQLGFLDVRMQEGLLSQAARQLDYDIGELESTLSQRQKLSRMLGVSAGIFCVVMFL